MSAPASTRPACPGRPATVALLVALAAAHLPGCHFLLGEAACELDVDCPPALPACVEGLCRQEGFVDDGGAARQDAGSSRRDGGAPGDDGGGADDGGAPGDDGGGADDGGGPGDDGGVDGGGAPEDAGEGGDAGLLDGGASGQDAGATDEDAGATDEDAGATDAGASDDAGLADAGLTACQRVGCTGCSERAHTRGVYVFCGVNQTWTGAQTACVGGGGELASLANSVEHDFVAQNGSTLLLTSWWIGLNDRTFEDQFQWSDGTSFFTTFDRWGSGEPNGQNNDLDDCVAMTDAFQSTWFDTACTDFRPFVCLLPD